MEYPSKRRRIQRRSARSLVALPSTENGQVATHPPAVAGDSLIAVPEIAVPNPVPDTPRGFIEQIRTLKPRTWRLNLRDLIPATTADVANAANKAVQDAAAPVATPAVQAVDNTGKAVAEPAQQITEPVTTPAQHAVDETTDATQQAVNGVTQPVQNQVVEPIANDANKALNPTGAASQPVDVPGTVAPPAAEAAQTAREQALAQQEAEAAKGGADVPGAGGPPPPASVPSADEEAKKEKKIEKENGNPAPLQIPDQTTQLPLSEPATPAPANPTPVESNSPLRNSEKEAPLPAAGPAATPAAGGSTSNNATITIQSSGSSSRGPSASMSSLLASSHSSPETASLSLMPTSSPSSANPTSTLPSSFGFQSSIASSGFITSTYSTANSTLSTSTQSSYTSASSTGGEGLVGSTASAGGPAGSTTTAAASSNGNNGMPPTKTLVGGICGGIAGLVLIIAALLFLLRWRKGRVGQRRDISPPVPQSAEAGSAALGGGGAMTQRSSLRSTAPIAAAAGLLGRLRPASSQTATTSSTGPSEKGFQKISGRKLPSVLHSGGDGYGDTPVRGPNTGPRPQPKAITPGQGPFAGLAPGLRPPSPQRSLSGSSFYRDSHGFYGGVVPVEGSSDNRTDPSSSPTSSSPTFPAPPSAGAPLISAGHPPGRSSPGIPNIRPGPARQPVIQQGGVVPMRTPSRPGTSQQRPVPSPITESPRDALGRSHPSQDGSRQSRFRESTTPP